MKEFGEIGTAGLPESQILATSCFQSQMHFGDSVESSADSDLEDGKLQKMLTSPPHHQKASKKPDAKVMQERGKCTFTQADRQSFRSHPSEGQKACGKPIALFSPEQGHLIRSSAFRNDNLSNLRRSHHLLNQTRSDLAKQELHAESLTSVNYNDKQRSKDWRYRTHNTDLLNLDENKFDYKKNWRR